MRLLSFKINWWKEFLNIFLFEEQHGIKEEWNSCVHQQNLEKKMRRKIFVGLVVIYIGVCVALHGLVEIK